MAGARGTKRPYQNPQGAFVKICIMKHCPGVAKIGPKLPGDEESPARLRTWPNYWNTTWQWADPLRSSHVEPRYLRYLEPHATSSLAYTPLHGLGEPGWSSRPACPTSHESRMSGFRKIYRRFHVHGLSRYMHLWGRVENQPCRFFNPPEMLDIRPILHHVTSRQSPKVILGIST